MSDENSNPVSNQISQDNQAIINQTGEDFVLDFGDDEIKNDFEIQSIEKTSLEKNNAVDEGGDVENLDLNNNFLDEEKKESNGDAGEGDIEIEDKNVDNEEFDGDFEISFDEIGRKENDGEVSDGNEKSLDLNAEQDVNMNGNENEELSDKVEENSEDSQDNGNIVGLELEDNENNLFIDKSNIENIGENVADNDEGSILNGKLNEGEDEMFLNEMSGDKIKEEDRGDNSSDKVKTDFRGDLVDFSENNEGETFLLDGKSKENLNENVNMNFSEEPTNNLENHIGQEILMEPINDIKIDSDQEILRGNINKPENDGSQEIQLYDISNEDGSGKQVTFTETIDNSENNGNQEISVDGVNNVENGGTEQLKQSEISVDGVNNTENDGTEQLKQPEISDLLGDSPVEFPLESSEEDIVDSGEKVGNAVQNDVEENKEQEKSDITDVSDKSDFVLENSENLENNTEGKNNNILANNYENVDNNVINEKRDGINLSEISSENAQDVVEGGMEMNLITNSVDADNYKENVSVVDNNITSTLSLDEILDTELNNNPQFVDNSKAVPVNVIKHNGLFSNKMVGIVVGVGMFLLVGLTAVLAFPPRNSDRKPGSVVNTGENIEINIDYGDEYSGHNIADSITGTDEQGSMDLSGGEIISHATKTTVQQPDFPDVGWEDEGESFGSLDGANGGNPVPYVCDGENCIENDSGGADSTYLKVGDVMDVISDFRSQADIYYSQGDEMQDKKLIKYSLQMISLCNNYQEQIETGEGLDETNFASFKSRGEVLLNKMEKYLIGEDYNEYSQNIKEGNNFE